MVTAEDIWMQTICQGDPKAMLKLYSPDAVLVATFAPAPLTTRSQIFDYFVKFLGGKPGLCGKVLTRYPRTVSQNGYVSSGLYIFQWKENGQLKSQKARYTYVWTKCPYSGSWKILTHHSSVVPDA